MIKGWDEWGYPEFMTDEEERWWEISQDWDYHDYLISRNVIDMESWLHDSNHTFYAAYQIDHLSETPYQPKPARDIRAEKTRDYRKRRPKSPRYNPSVIPAASVLFCLIGAQS